MVFEQEWNHLLMQKSQHDRSPTTQNGVRTSTTKVQMKSPARAEELTGLCECLLPRDLVGLGFVRIDSFLFFLRNWIPVDLSAPFCVKSPSRSACFPLFCFQYNSYCRGKHSASSSISSSTGCFFTAHFCDPLRAWQNNSSYISTPL